MKPINILVSIDQLQILASRSNFRLGKAIAEDGEIAFDKSNTFNLIAKVKYKNGEVRTAQLESTPKGLRWKCSCTNRKGIFCEHCVALGIALQEKETGDSHSL